jgi:parvulin-like peptidyl-prolyl isomerase
VFDWVKKEARQKIDQASTDLKAGRKFSSVAKEFSEDSKTAEKGGDVGFVIKGQGGLLPKVADTLIKMKVGETSGIIESNIGFHIVQLNDKKDRQAIPLDKVKAEILNHLLKFETEKLLKNYLSKLRKKSDIKIFF